MLHTSDVGTSTQVQTHTEEAKGKQEINSAEVCLYIARTTLMNQLINNYVFSFTEKFKP